jgi:hypothetical protein
VLAREFHQLVPSSAKEVFSPMEGSLSQSQTSVHHRKAIGNQRQTKSCMKSPYEPELVVLCEARLQELTGADIADLTEFAECRLVMHGAPPAMGEDVTQRAFQQVLQGLETDQGGRRPRLVDLTNKPAFLNYLRGVISSLVNWMTSKSGFAAGCALRDDDLAESCDDGGASAKDAELNDLRDQLFPRLRARAPKRLLATLDAWEPVFTQSDRIPAPGQRSYVREVRDLAKEVLAEIGGLD